jgi:hypothetical protein
MGKDAIRGQKLEGNSKLPSNLATMKLLCFCLSEKQSLQKAICTYFTRQFSASKLNET